MSSPSPLQCTVATAPKWRSVRTKPHWQSRSGSAKCGVLHGPGVPLNPLTTEPPATPASPAAERGGPPNLRCPAPPAPPVRRRGLRPASRRAAPPPPASTPASLPGPFRPRQGSSGLGGCSCVTPQQLHRPLQVRHRGLAALEPRHRAADQADGVVYLVGGGNLAARHVLHEVRPQGGDLSVRGVVEAPWQLGAHRSRSLRAGVLQIVAVRLVGRGVVVVRSRRLELAVRCVGVAVSKGHHAPPTTFQPRPCTHRV